jgi:hypothetical protein
MWVDNGAPSLRFESPAPQNFWYSLFVQFYAREFWTKFSRRSFNGEYPTLCHQDSNLVVRELLEEIEIECARHAICKLISFILETTEDTPYPSGAVLLVGASGRLPFVLVCCSVGC